MINWREFDEGGFRFTLPEPLRRTLVGTLFKGKIVKGVRSTELVVLFNPDVNAAFLTEFQRGLSEPPPFTQWEGLTWTYHIWGASETRPGGWEVKTSQTAPNPCGRGYRWAITFPLGGKWVQVDIANGGGGLEWKVFEEIADRIIKSVQAG